MNFIKNLTSLAFPFHIILEVNKALAFNPILEDYQL